MDNMNETAAESTVLFRDVLLFRAAKENLLTANETNTLLLDIIRNTRTQLLNVVSSEETITIQDAVCNLRDVLVMCYRKGESWESLALELNQLFERKKNWKPFNVQDLLTYLRSEPVNTLAFAPPYDADTDVSGSLTGAVRIQNGTEKKAAPVSGSDTEVKDGAENRSEQEATESRTPEKDNAPETKPAEETQKSASEKESYTARDPEGRTVNWAELAGKSISCNGTVYRVTAGRSGNSIFLTSVTNETLEASDFNDQQVIIEVVDSKEA